MANSKTILITGASGFLGTWLADEAAEAGHILIGIDLRAPLRPWRWAGFSTSSLETVDLLQTLEGRRIDAVMHLAGGASVPASTKDPYGDFYSLLPGTARLAAYIAKFQPQARLFFFSSAAVYGNAIKLPICECAPVVPISPYGVHKATAESLLSHYARILGLKLTVFRIFSVYGPGLRKQLIWDVCQRAIAAHKNGQKAITLFGTGKESRDFIYVADLCRAALSLLHQPANGHTDIYNLASGTASTIADVTQNLLQHLQLDTRILFDGVVRNGDPANWCADTSRLNNAGFECRYSLSEGLKDVAVWAKALDAL